MLKKIMLSALCICAAASVFAAPRIKIEQGSKVKLMETYIRAAAYDDAEAMWQIIDPAMREKAIQEVGSEKQAIKEFWNGFRKTCPSSLNESLQRILHDPERKKESIDALLNMYGRWLVRKNGKWYLNPLNN